VIVDPRRPDHPNPFAAAFLDRLKDRPEAEQFVLGGYFALKHYLDYRDTGDIDAWWRTRQDAQALAVARKVFAETAAEFGYLVRERAWGETISDRDEFTAPPVVGRGERRHDSEEPAQ